MEEGANLILKDTLGGIVGVVLSNITPSGKSLPSGSRVNVKCLLISKEDKLHVARSMLLHNTSKVGKPKTQ